MAHAFGHAFGHAAAHVGGVALHGAIATGIASHKTVVNRRKERLFEKTGGLSGFSRTKANKEVTKDWSAATAGTGAAIGATMGGAAIGTVCVVPSIYELMNNSILFSKIFLTVLLFLSFYLTF